MYKFRDRHSYIVRPSLKEKKKKQKPKTKILMTDSSIKERKIETGVD